MIRIGKYRRIKELGKGGNGIVYEVELNGERLAMKILKNFFKTTRYARFRDEVNALNNMGPIENVVTMLDYNLPAEPTKQDIPFYVMPIGIPFVRYNAGKNHKELFISFLKITNAVIMLHKAGYTHRDIKPDNLLYINNQPILSDFGFDSFPDKSSKSKENEKIGPQWTIAPEMQRTSSTAEFQKADVYSMAKTLWILITGSKFGFEGQYIPNSNISINRYVEVMINKSTIAGQWYYHSTVILDELLSASTDNDPEKRPTAEEFCQILNFWLTSNDDFRLRNPYEWKNALKVIFPHGMPEICEWKDRSQILSVLGVLVNYDNLNHFFYPTQGGEDKKTIKLAPDGETLVINDDLLIRPEKLIFRTLGDYELSYFRLVVEDSEGFTNQLDEDAKEEEYFADENYNFIAASVDDEEDHGINVSRFLKGSFIFVNKRSKINALRGIYRDNLYLDGYSGIHDIISHEEYHRMLGRYARN